MLEDLARDKPFLDRAGLGDLRNLAPVVRVGLAAAAEIPVLGAVVKVPNEALKQLAAEKSDEELKERFERLFAIGAQTNEEIAVLTVLAAALFAQQRMLLEQLREHGTDIEERQLTDFAKAAALVAYRSRIARDYQYADHRGIEGVTRAAHVTSLELEDVYVVPRLVPERERDSTVERERDLLRRLTRDSDLSLEERARLEEEYAVLTGERWGRGKKEGEAGLPLGEALEGARHGVVIGSPGVGKSTLSRYLARVCALGEEGMQRRIGWGEPLVPVLIPLALFADARRTAPSLRLRDFLDTKMGERGGDALREAMSRVLADGGALILLDGVDEVPESRARAAVVQAVDEFISDWASNRIIVTSRPYGYVPLKGDLPHFQLPNFSPEQVDQFVHNWQRASERKQHPDAPNLGNADAEADALLKEIRRNPKVAELATNPLMLVIVSLIRYEKARLPDERVQLYNKAVNTLMDTWNQWRSLPGADVGGATLPLDRLVRVWGAIAEWTRRTKNTGIMHRAELKRELVRVLKDKEFDEDDPQATAESYLRAAADRAGLLEERGTDIFAFWHPTFEEFLAAVDLATPAVRAAHRLLPVAEDPRWREVILLAVGYVGVVQRDGETATALVSSIMDEDLPPQEPITHPRLRLAAACIRDDVGVKRTLARGVIARLAEVVHRQPYDALTEAFVQTVRSLPRLQPAPDTTASLAPLVEHPSWEVRMEAARLLANSAAHDEAALALCERLLEDHNEDVRVHAALGLARTNHFGPSTWVSLGHFQSPRAYAKEAIHDFLTNAQSNVIDSLLKHLASEESQVRLAVGRLLKEVGHSAEEVIRAVAPLLHSEDPTVRVPAGHLLLDTGYSQEEVIHAVTPLLATERVRVRFDAWRLLQEIGQGAKEVVNRAVAPLLESENANVRIEAGRILLRTGYSQEEIVRVVAPLLHSEDPTVRLDAGRLLLDAGCSQEEIIEVVTPLLDSADPDVRIDAGRLLLNMARAREEVIRAVAPLLDAEDLGVRFDAGYFLQTMGPSATEEAFRAIGPLLRSENVDVRLEAAFLLIETEYPQEEVIRAIAPLLDSEDKGVQFEAEDLLQEIEHASMPLQIVIDLLEPENEAAAALTAISAVQSDSPAPGTVEYVVDMVTARREDSFASRWARERLFDLLLRKWEVSASAR